MNVPANVSGERLASDYLARVTVAGLTYLPKGDRIAFVGRTRKRIEDQCGPLAESSAGAVAAMLADLGDAEELVKAERRRIDEVRLRRRYGSAADPDSAAPWQQRPVTSRWKPASSSRPGQARPRP
ncbi:MAG: hypothetical protein J2P32_06795, partial [Actinobacteria bacterium]|nr:hypothetical protein [Actinomycetota bacterium]